MCVCVFLLFALRARRDAIESDARERPLIDNPKIITARNEMAPQEKKKQMKYS